MKGERKVERERGRGKKGREGMRRETILDEYKTYFSGVCLLYTLSYSCGDRVAGLCSLCVHGDYEALNSSTNLLGG